MSVDSFGFTHLYGPARTDTLPTLLLLHGTGGSETDLVEFARSALPGAGILSPRGNVTENGMVRYFRRLAEGVFDLDDLRFRVAELAEFVGRAASAYGFDPRCVIALGYSNGANMAASLLLLRPDTLCGAVLLRPMLPLIPEPLPNLSGKPVLVCGGRRDTVIPAASTSELAALLSAAGAELREAWPDTGHGLVRADCEHVSAWLATHAACQPPTAGG